MITKPTNTLLIAVEGTHWGFIPVPFYKAEPFVDSVFADENESGPIITLRVE